MSNDVFTVIDRNGNELLRRPSDYLNPPTAYKLAQAFPDERALAIRRKRALLRDLRRFDDAIDRIYAESNYADEVKQVLVVIIQTWKEIDPEMEELKKIDQYLRIIPNQAKEGEPVPTQREQLNIEKAKQVPIQSLFDPQHPREISSSISCCCPFHNERTPSFVIYKKSNRYKCFGCSESGDSIHFYMKMHNVDFPTAVRALT